MSISNHAGVDAGGTLTDQVSTDGVSEPDQVPDVAPNGMMTETTDAATSGHSSSHSTDASRIPRTDASGGHGTGVADSGRWSTRNIAIYALFVALAMALSFLEFPIIPGIAWLKYDPSGIVCLIAGFIFGPAAAAIVSVLGFLPHLFMDPWGTLMAVAVALALSVPAAAVYRRRHTRAGAVLALVAGALVALAVAIGGNLVITPFYAHMSVAQVAALILPALLPFNVVKFAIHGVVTFLVYKPVSNLVRR